MTINWRQRAPVLRLLAAVYAELGEDALKGHYGRIARLFGEDATYDAVKSFFAKDVVKLADELKAKNTDHDGVDGERRIRTLRPGQQRPRAVQRQRPIRIDFDESEDEIVVMGERDVRPDERSSQPPTNGTIQGRVGSEPFYDGCKIDPAILNASSGSREAHDTTQHYPSVTPGPSSRPNLARQQQSIRPSPAQEPRSRKRPSSVLEEANDQDGGIRRPSFGYLTNQGRHRCALCKTELSSAEMLRKHESMSELHLTNLRDPMVVSKGWMTLSSVTNGVSDSVPRLARIPLLAPPSKRVIADAPNDSASDTCCTDRRKEKTSTTFHERSRSTVAPDDDIDMTDTIIVTSEVSRNKSQQPPRQPMVEDANSVAGSESRPALSRDIEVVQQAPGINLGKCRAQTVPTDDRREATSPATSQPKPQPQPSSWQPRAPMEQEGTHNGTALPSIQRLLSGDIGAASNIPPTILVQALLSSGMELLVKKCIEEHPELNADFYKSVKGLQQGLGRVNGGSE